MRISRIIMLCLWIAAISLHASANSVQSVTVLVDGKQMPVSPPPVLRGGRVYVPVTMFRQIGMAVEQKSSREAWVGWPESDSIVRFKAGVRRYVEQYEEKVVRTLPGTPFVRRGVLMVPLRSMLSDTDVGTSITAEWNSKTRTIYVHRSKSWLRWRLDIDTELIKNCPDWYSHLWLGEYIPILPKNEIARAKKLDASGNWQDALKILRSLVESKPFTWDTRSGPSYYQDEREAYGPLGRILIREQPNQGEGYLYMGIGRAISGDYPGAEEAFRQGVEIDPTSADLRFAAGWVILQQERVETVFQRNPKTVQKALALFEEALEIEPLLQPALRSAGYASLALAYLENKDYTEESKLRAKPYAEKAVGYFERLFQLTTPGTNMHYLLWDIYRQLGQQDKALEHYRQYAFAASEPERRWRLRDLADMYEKAGKPDEAAAIRRKLK